MRRLRTHSFTAQLLTASYAVRGSMRLLSNGRDTYPAGQYAEEVPDRPGSQGGIYGFSHDLELVSCIADPGTACAR